MIINPSINEAVMNPHEDISGKRHAQTPTSSILALFLMFDKPLPLTVWECVNAPAKWFNNLLKMRDRCELVRFDLIFIL